MFSMLTSIKYLSFPYSYSEIGVNKKMVVSILLSLLLVSMTSLALPISLNVVKADPQNTSVNPGNASGIIISKVTSDQDFVEQGFNIDLNVSVENADHSASTCNLTICANSIPLGTHPVILTGNSNTKVNFVWNTTGFALGNYTLSAYAWSITGKSTFVDTNCTGSNLLVTCPGDMSGHFGVDFSDITAFVASYINYYQTGVCNPNADFEHTGQLNFNDVLLFAQAYVAYYAGPTPFVMSGGLQLSLSIPQTTYQLYDLVNFTLSITNLSNHTITFGQTATTFDFLVYNNTGPVYKYSDSGFFPTWAKLTTLQPGENLTESFSWDQDCDTVFSAASCMTACPAVFLASPGTYYIVGQALGLQTAPQQIVILSS